MNDPVRGKNVLFDNVGLFVGRVRVDSEVVIVGVLVSDELLLGVQCLVGHLGSEAGRLGVDDFGHDVSGQDGCQGILVSQNRLQRRPRNLGESVIGGCKHGDAVCGRDAALKSHQSENVKNQLHQLKRGRWPAPPLGRPPTEC